MAQEEVGRLLTALAEGGAVDRPPAETSFARRFGVVTDRFGTAWILGCERPMEGA